MEQAEPLFSPESPPRPPLELWQRRIARVVFCVGLLVVLQNVAGPLVLYLAPAVEEVFPDYPDRLAYASIAAEAAAGLCVAVAVLVCRRKPVAARMFWSGSLLAMLTSSGFMSAVTVFTFSQRPFASEPVILGSRVVEEVILQMVLPFGAFGFLLLLVAATLLAAPNPDESPASRPSVVGRVALCSLAVALTRTVYLIETGFGQFYGGWRMLVPDGLIDATYKLELFLHAASVILVGFGVGLRLITGRWNTRWLKILGWVFISSAAVGLIQYAAFVLLYSWDLPGAYRAFSLLQAVTVAAVLAGSGVVLLLAMPSTKALITSTSRAFEPIFASPAGPSAVLPHVDPPEVGVRE